jgi:hypothetical protein
MTWTEIADDADALDAKKPKETAAQILIRLADVVYLTHTVDGDPYATLPLNGHDETWPVRSRAVKDWLTRAYYLETRKTPNRNALTEALDLLEARARFDGAERAVHVRVAPRDAGGFFLDLADAEWRAIEITGDGWQVVSDPQARFRRKAGMLALPDPVRGGSVEEIRDYLNIGTDDAWKLVLAWLTHAMTTRGPYCTLALHGEQGSAKSTTARVLRRLIDPHKVELRSEPRDDRDLMIAAEGSWIITFDNLSAINRERSDQLCRLSTGGGFGTRALYTDDEERLFDAMRPVVLTGIEELASAGDLLDRSIVLTLPSLDEDGRMEEEDFWEAFEASRARLLGSLLDVVCRSLRALPTSRPGRLCRMADFHRWGAAVEQALGWPAGSFTLAYTQNRGDAVGISLEASPVPPVLVEWLDGRESWAGTASTLLGELERQAGDRAKRKAWPSAPNVLSGALRRLAPALRHVGIHVTFGKEGKARNRTIYLACKVGNGASQASGPSAGEPAADDADGADGVLPTLHTQGGLNGHEPREEYP